ncbi:Hemolysin activation/secretion protein [Duganella sp. CF517]|uniref:ShlB/FhaC/HecB family hemolysin secretion/activation protein n=1 Tax=Duganella sp. CF517 TaxID=1881038 RepID=UPI0008C1C0B2|nr:ShlB/FhaC/HecB family hemolysin secretion/activation protein [Duganella sp. CF517]SEO09886.1 Hemolysin activation/secretion protein [Duganella sp. CF517]
MRPALTLLAAAAAVIAGGPALAQQRPDAGQLLQENAPRALPPPAPAAPPPLPPAAAATPVAPGGATVALQRVAVTGNSLFSEAILVAALGPVAGKSFDFAGLSALAERISAHYRAAGYPFARAYLPPQDMQRGELTIAVLEGRYGDIVAHGDAGLSAPGQRFLSPLRPGTVIESQALERVTLILDDQPGIKSTPVVKPGREVGTGDLAVEVRRAHRYAGEVGLDNDGNRYTGRRRVHVNLDVDSPLTLGDQLALQGMYTDEHMWFGSASYALPLNASGLRGRVGYTHSYYALADSFASLDATGTADVASAGLSYPLIRSQRRNLTLSGSVEHKRLNDRQGATGSSSDKSSDALPLALNFDARDSVLRGAVTYGAVSWTPGRLRLDGALARIDAASARSAGRFNKFNIDLARIQSVSDGVDVYGRVSAQWASKNLDSSQKFGLGGRNGVRAYPSGEGYGDTGMLAQLELRYAVGGWLPYVFADAGRVKANRERWSGDGAGTRRLGGAGVGVRYGSGAVTGALIVAWRTTGGAPLSEPGKRQPLAWANVAYRF